MSLANALFLYICCILEYLYLFNRINYIFSIIHFILWFRDLMVSADVVLRIFTSKSLADGVAVDRDGARGQSDGT